MLFDVALNTADNSWQLTAATLVGLMSVPGLVVLYGGVMQKRWSVNSMMLAFIAFALVLLVWVLYGFKMAFGNPVARTDGLRVLRQLHRSAGGRARARIRAGRREHPAPQSVAFRSDEQGAARRLPAVLAGLFPVRLRRDHAAADARIDPRPRQLQGLDPVRRSLDDLRLHRQRVPDLGRRLVRPEGRDRLLGRLRDPSLRRRVRIRRRLGDRPTTCPRPRDRRAEQPADGRRRRRPPVARLERLQRRRSLQRRPGRLVGRAEHEPRDRGRVPRVGRLRLRDQAQAVAARQRQRHDRRPRRDHPGGRLRQRLGSDRDRSDRLGHRLHRLQLPGAAAPVPERRRHARRRLHPRLRRARRRAAHGRARRQGVRLLGCPLHGRRAGTS